MSLRKKFQQIKSDWDAASQAVERATERDRRRREAHQAAKAARGECDQHGCNRAAEKDGKCMPCWSAIFGGVV